MHKKDEVLSFRQTEIDLICCVAALVVRCLILLALASYLTRSHFVQAEPSKSPTLVKAGELVLPYGIQSMAWHPNGKILAIGYFMRDEVVVWDVDKKTQTLSMPSRRRSINFSGQEVLFSPDGTHLVVQTTVDTKGGVPKFPKGYDDPAEIPAQRDKQRYILATVWNLDRQEQTAELKGPGSARYGGAHRGMCWLPDGTLAVLRSTGVALYRVKDGKQVGEIDLGYPFADNPKFRHGYQKMACHPKRSEIALEGGALMKKAPEFGFPISSGATPIVLVNISTEKVEKVLFSETALNGVVYTKSGKYLASFGRPPIRVWDASSGYQLTGLINDPSLNSGDLVAAEGGEGVFGIADQAYIWDLSKLRKVARFDIPRDVIRVAQKDNNYAVAEGNTVHFFKLAP